MGTELTISQINDLPKHLNPETVASMTRSWPDLAKRRLKSKDERDRVAAIIQKASTKATAKAIAVKIIPMLTEYFVALTNADVAKQVGANWQYELADYPLWAIHNACRWWISRENEYRHRKPVPGDISDRCHREMELIRIAQMRVDHFDLHGPKRDEDTVPADRPMTDSEMKIFKRQLSEYQDRWKSKRGDGNHAI